MDIDLVRAALGAESPDRVSGPGVYAWADTGAPGHPVLYIGKSVNVARRTADEWSWTEQFRDARRRNNTLWYSAGCALSPVLAAAAAPRVFSWPLAEADLAATETALIRLAAMTGGTPPAQGGGWGWGRGSVPTSPDPVHLLLNRWFAADHAVHRLAETAG